MKKSSDGLSDYELFFEEIGNRATQRPAQGEQIRKQNDYEKAPSLSEKQISQLSEDLKKLTGDKESSK